MEGCVVTSNKYVDPIKWAIWGAVFGAVLGAIAAMSGNPMPQTPVEAAMGGLFWGWILGRVRNKLAH
jgi:hypothetical protein